MSYTSNGDGLRQLRTVGAATDQFVWDTTASIPLLLTDGPSLYIYGPALTPVAQVDAAGVIKYLHTDNIDSVRLITDNAGAVVGGSDFTPYGAVSAHLGVATSNFGFATAWADRVTGFNYLRARDYDPATAGFNDGLTYGTALLVNDDEKRYGDNPAFWAEYVIGVVITSATLGTAAAPGAAVIFEEEEVTSTTVLKNPAAVKGLTPSHVDDLAKNAGYKTLPRKLGAANPVIRYYAPDTRDSVGFRVLPYGVVGQTGVKCGAYLRYFGGFNDGIRIPLG